MLLVFKTHRAYSKAALRVVRNDESGVRFSLGPPIRSLEDSGASRCEQNDRNSIIMINIAKSLDVPMKELLK